ncbi:hypothetical protein SO802_018324 [Lithocarpus litseifolius]|uniref:Reverse transcriptase zinc-binding domain-containing protein n=1 Tax=Lithocarpus litseifolius TaxID=425828 RepID=A0AAW2CKY2_9ROSI
MPLARAPLSESNERKGKQPKAVGKSRNTVGTWKKIQRTTNTTVREEWPNLQVGDLIDDRDWEWKRTMIEEIFAPRTCEEIHAIPLSREHTQDTLIWKENWKHEFSVKSAYHVVLRLSKQEVTEHSQAGVDRKLWKKVWKLNVPPKVRTFMWRACADILPTRDNLHRRRVDVDRNCEFFHQQPKTSAHLL